ncbi:MAG: tRNA (N(6)-L-threonylcarbamoyladenosine(37)-C(2))-methylthiotransferase MtaB [Zymomonas mobilis subsp. pomaceae]|uniref:tRNA (N(6)-L-threonylcarbamoyladenosine(37)-C(2))- methylthiotransferase MtaB n=1 Tax=Zymomonas mobilis TaxID=542 RepID=UPI0039EC4790
MSKPDIITLGCRLNIAESESIRQSLINKESSQDLIVINSCAVTSRAVAQTRQTIRRARRERPDARIVVTGCAAQIDPEIFAKMPEVSRVIGNIEKHQIQSFAFSDQQSDEDRVQVADINSLKETAPHLITAFSEHSRAFLEIQNGCDHNCSFCIIPQGRGRNRSASREEIIRCAERLVEAGHQELVLTGVDLTSYGDDLSEQDTLAHLIDHLLTQIKALKRIRLSSLDPNGVDDYLFELITGDERIMPHVHLSLQAGDDLILKRMRRRHTRAQSVELVSRLKAKRPQIVIGADLIAGFPTEDEQMAKNSLQLIEDCDIVFGHIFPYSPRQGTPAARMPQVHTAFIKERAGKLREAAAKQQQLWLQSLIGSHQSVLLEGDGYRGHTPQFAPIRLAEPVTEGGIVEIAVTSADKDGLIGKKL